MTVRKKSLKKSAKKRKAEPRPIRPPRTEFERLTVARFMESDVQSAHEGT
ncbi:MAG: hypothetical protein HY444_05880, partial [Nitrospirae bacterium]|nr:hypothetical protein [Nitrospirota bacterium]